MKIKFWALYSVSKQIAVTFLFFKMTAVGSHLGLKPAPEGTADFAEVVLGYCGPLVLNNRLHGVGRPERSDTGLALHVAPDAKVERSTIRQ